MHLCGKETEALKYKQRRVIRDEEITISISPVLCFFNRLSPQIRACQVYTSEVRTDRFGARF